MNSKENRLIPMKLDNTYEIIQCMNGIPEGVTASSGIETQNWNHGAADRPVMNFLFQFTRFIGLIVLIVSCAILLIFSSQGFGKSWPSYSRFNSI